MSENAIQAYQGQTFTVTLRSNGGTNFVWCLSTIPPGIALASEETTVVSPRFGSPVDKTFTFFALGEGSVKVGFKLLCWTSQVEDAEEVFFDIDIIPHNGADGLGGFVRYSENTATYNIPPYGYNGSAITVEKYGYPGCVKYGYPDCDASYDVAKYGYPGCVKYGYPSCDASSVAQDYGFPGCVKYCYPGCDDPSTNMKYGYPCFNNWPAPPIAAYNYPTVFKYGYPGCECWPTTASSISLYGYPGCVKYGYPSCV